MQTHNETQRHWMIGLGHIIPKFTRSPKARVVSHPMTITSSGMRYARPTEAQKTKLMTAIAIQIYMQQDDRGKIYDELIRQGVLLQKGDEYMDIETVFRYIQKVRKILGWKPRTLKSQVMEKIRQKLPDDVIAKTLGTNVRHVQSLRSREKCRIKKVKLNERKKAAA